MGCQKNIEMKDDVIYLGYYATSDMASKMSVSMAGVAKMHYIISALRRIGRKVKIVSPVNPNVTGYISGKTCDLGDGCQVSFLQTYGGNSLIARVIRKILYRTALTRQLAKLNEHSIVIAYHSLGYAKLLYRLKRLIGFKLILEVEEIYQDVKSYSTEERKAEFDVINCADAYIFPTESLNKNINFANKPALVVCGDYLSAPVLASKRIDDFIHVVYAGTFDVNKGGALAAIDAVQYLPQNFHMHILGFGSKEEISNVKARIRETEYKSKAQITYEGSMMGVEFNQFIQTCHVGLSTQNAAAKFNASSFPSKILMYMANGLDVVSVDIPVVRESPVADYIEFYENGCPKALADAIVRVSQKQETDIPAVLQKLDEQFCESLKSLLQTI